MNAIEQEKTVFESISPQKEYEVIQKITNFFSKIVRLYLIYWVAFLFNGYICHISSVLKTVKCQPVQENGRRCDCNNFRLVSLLKNLVKVFEKLIKNQLRRFLKSYKVLTFFQYNFFIEKHSWSYLRTHWKFNAGFRQKCRVCVDVFRCYKSVRHNLAQYFTRKLQTVWFGKFFFKSFEVVS